jgi:hypothetical protein
MPDQNAPMIAWWRNLTPRRVVSITGEILAWIWFAVAGGGGFGLILTEGALPLTHGWFAMFSGISLCPGTAWLLKRYGNVEISFLTRFIVAALFIAAGRLALVIGAWPIGPH